MDECGNLLNQINEILKKGKEQAGRAINSIWFKLIGKLAIIL